MNIIDTKSLGQKDIILKLHAKRARLTFPEAEALWEGLNQFLRLCADNPGTYQVASQPVDELWHDFLQFTESYREYCQNNFGKFIHHLPATSTQPSGYFDTRDALENKLGILPSVVWPAMERTEWSVGYTVE